MVAEKITALVPTRNRPKYVLRLARYWQSCGSLIRLKILDSSDELSSQDDLYRILDQGDATGMQFPPEISLAQKLLLGLETVTTPYVVIWADDDFIVPKTLADGAQFLEKNPEYSAVSGQSGLFTVQETQYGQKISSVGSYTQRTINASRATERLRDHFDLYTTNFYSLQRTEMLCESMREYWSGQFNYNNGELFLSANLVIRGKCISLNRLYMMRQSHAFQSSAYLGDLFDSVVDKDFPRQYECLLTHVSELLAKRDNISLNEAKEAVKSAMWCYYAKGLLQKWQVRSASNQINLRQGLKQIRLVRWLWRQLRSVIFLNTMSLPALLNPASPDHADFMPIYKIVTEQD